ncbi:MAG TPA: flavin reductase [Lachnospiraceae bacterium]|nr:flavin reductase [Lachnospiraceae bacterium]
MNSKTMFRLSYGLFVLTANNGKDNGCITNTAIQVTSEPNRISFAVNKANYTNEMLTASDDFTVSIISEEADFELFKHFGFQSGRTVDKFSGFSDLKRVENGTLAITRGTNGYISGRIINRIDLGTHTLFIADVTDMELLSDAPSATYTYYQEHIKPKPKEASDAEKGKVVWRCKVCGYEYEGEELPEDFICPVCKHPASDFEKVVK